MAVAHLGAARGQDVVERAGAHLGGEEHPPGHDIDVELARRLAARNDLELKVHPVDRAGIAGADDRVGRRNQGDFAGGQARADPRSHLSLRARGQGGAELVGCAAAHRGPGHHAFRSGFLHEVVGSDDRHLSGLDVGLADNPAHPPVVIAMAVAVDHRHHRSRAKLGVGKCEGGRGGFAGGQRVDHDPPGVAADDRHVGNVEAANLPDPVANLVKPVKPQIGHLAPQRGVDRGRGRTGHEIVGGEVPHRLALLVADQRIFKAAKEPAPREFGIAAIFGRKGLHCGLLRGDGCGAGRLGLQRGIGRDGRGRGGLGKGAGRAQQQGGGGHRQQAAVHRWVSSLREQECDCAG